MIRMSAMSRQMFGNNFGTVAAAAAVNPYAAYMVLGMHMDDAGLTDVTGKTVTLNGNAARSATQSKFGGYSAYFDGTGDSLLLPDSADFSFGSGDFSVRFWFRADSVTSANDRTFANITQNPNTAYDIVFGIKSTGKVDFQLYNGVSYDVNITGTTTISLNTWHHYEITRSGNTFKLFLDGVQEATATAAANITTTPLRLYIGDYIDFSSTYSFPGYIDDFEIYKGVAIHTSNFTPPTSAFINP